MRLSLLDRSRTRTGEPESAALTSSIERAVRAEASGYHRFWVAEHHGVPGIASGSPPVLLAAIGARTTTIRLGSGGVMLPHHQPLVVAEQFLMLDALHPGRLDLGLGRSRGFTEPVRRALRTESATDTFAADVRELRGYLDGTGAVTARPAGSSSVPLFVLATGRGIDLAADLGLPVVVGGPVLADAEAARAALDGYRARFRPQGPGDSPYVVMSLDLYVADTEDAARELALPEAWAMARARQTGEFAPLEPVAEIRARRWSDQLRRRVDDALDRAWVATPSSAGARLEELQERTGADELLVSTSTFDRDALAASDRALADAAQGLA